MGANTDSMELIELEQDANTGVTDVTDTAHDREAAARRRASFRRIGVVGAAVAGLILILVVLPVLGVTYPHSRAIVPALSAPSEKVLEFFGITPVLVAVAALTMVAVVRKLPYGIGAVIGAVVGASLTTAAVRTWADGLVPTSALPNGYVTAALVLLSAATLVSSPRYLPMVWGLGTVGAVTVAAAAILGGSASVVGILTTMLIVFAAWAAAAAVMVYSPAAAQREAANPLDTAAMALRRR